MSDCVVDIEDIVGCYKTQSFRVDNVESLEFKRSQLLVWYRTNRRMLPWRGDNTTVNRTPYGTWVSEVMLQQTRVETVIDYWNKWMVRFPTVQALSVATPDEVNQSWAGLGYYRRAQQLLKGAQFVMKEFDGVVPSAVSDLLRIPGVGPYTAGAIASIAFDLSEPLVDGNVIRVLSRLYAISLEAGATGGAMEKRCWSLAGQLVDPVSPGDFNQSLMELGATICKPLSPLCSACPVSSVCKARLLVAHCDGKSSEDRDDLPNNVSYFPRKVPKKRAREVSVSVCVFAASSMGCSDEKGLEVRYLFNRRPATGLLANQWEFPSVVMEQQEQQQLEEEEEEGKTELFPSTEALWTPFPAYLRDSLGVRFVPCVAECVGSDDSDKSDSRVKMVVFECSASPLVAPSPCPIEPIVHVFSHQRHTMHVTVRHVGHIEEIDTSISTTGSGNGPALRWMTSAQIEAEGITTGCKKVLQAVERPPAVAAKKTKKLTVIAKSESVCMKPPPASTQGMNAFEVMRTAAASSSFSSTTAVKKGGSKIGGTNKGVLEMSVKKTKQN